MTIACYATHSATYLGSWKIHYGKTVLRPRFKNAAIGHKNAAYGPFGEEEEEEEEEEVWACGFGSDGGCGGDGFMFLFWRKRVSAMEAEMEGLWVRHRGYS